VKMELVRIPAGSFMMGSDKGRNNEKPVHKVTISKPFYIGRYEVTQEQWEAVMGSNPSCFKAPKNPVQYVSWNDCQAFVKKLNAKVRGAAYGLPTAAEWEYACRAGSTGTYCFGEDVKMLDDYAWYGANSSKKTHPVGQKKPNTFALFDMYGNVWEWCQDWHKDDYYRDSPKENPRGAAAGEERVLRGGSWSHDRRTCRSAYRGRYNPLAGWSTFGLRLVLRGGVD